jgi:hypothetical protein
MSDGWCPFAIPCPGLAEKTGYSGKDKTHAKVGVVLHTMEYESTPEWNDATTLHNALFSGREASWTFSICKFMNGSILYQHYPLDAVTWHAGYQGNLWLIGIETEGIAPGKFTEAQFALLVKTLRWVKEEHGWLKWWGIGDRTFQLSKLDQPLNERGWLFEHNAVPGASATDCAVFSRGQVDPDRLLRDLREEGDMTQDWHARRWPSGLLRQVAGHAEAAAGLVDHAWSGTEYAELEHEVRAAAEKLDKARQILRDNGLGPETGDWRIDTF